MRRSAVSAMGRPVDGRAFREVLGHFCTGIVVIGATGGDGLPVGFACQSFSALSLDPPLVLFCPAKSSRTWPVIERAGRFAANMLAEGQRGVCEVFGRSGQDKFACAEWRASPNGSPLLDSALAWVDCTVETVHDAGDHYIVVGRVTAMDASAEGRPLLFFRGGYTAAQAGPDPAVAPPEFLAWVEHDAWF
ncbi:3-hydroxy-9,10-secoandrosta-1,3,5(10)-triene-9,17-dione monooxygenase reductase subunit [Spirillospora sp. NPDC050679]